MKAFILPAGSTGEIMTLNEHGKQVWRQYTTKVEHMFFDEDIAFDPIRQHNTGKPSKDTWEGQAAAEGMIGFSRKGKQSDKMYMLVVPYHKISVH